MAIVSVNPTTGETIKTFESLSIEQVEQKLQLAANTFLSYRCSSFSERAAFMRLAAGILENDKKEFAGVMTTEMGKPIKAALQEVEKCAWVCRYYAEEAKHHL